MPSYELAADNAIVGDQLAAELLAATGLRLLPVFVPPRTVRIADVPEALDAAVAAAVAAHAPVEAENAAVRRQLRQAVQGTVGVLLTDLTAQQQRALLAALLFRAGAFDATMKIKPLSEWLT